MKEQSIYRYFGIIRAEQMLYDRVRECARDSIRYAFGSDATPFKIKVVARKLTRFHTDRYFIAYFDAQTHVIISATMRDLVTWRQLEEVCGQPSRVVIHDTRNAMPQALVKVHYITSLDVTPCTATPTDFGMGPEVNQVAPSRPTPSHRKPNKYQFTASVSSPKPTPSVRAADPLVLPLEERR